MPLRIAPGSSTSEAIKPRRSIASLPFNLRSEERAAKRKEVTASFEYFLLIGFTNCFVQRGVISLFFFFFFLVLWQFYEKLEERRKAEEAAKKLPQIKHQVSPSIERVHIIQRILLFERIHFASPKFTYSHHGFLQCSLKHRSPGKIRARRRSLVLRTTCSLLALRRRMLTRTPLQISRIQCLIHSFSKKIIHREGATNTIEFLFLFL